MRTTVTALMAISVFFVGIFAISESAQQHESGVNTSAEQETFNATEGVFEGVVAGGGEAVIWAGVAAVVLVALGVLVKAGGGR